MHSIRPQNQVKLVKKLNYKNFTLSPDACSSLCQFLDHTGRPLLPDIGVLIIR